ncbi:MAG TPA: GAF domain-containing protein [Bryobacteraceae bacterium]|nr:GAF domain-containing protein [Bryobacteraceae bacterium]
MAARTLRLVLALVGAAAGAAQTTLTLEEASKRNSHTLTPVHENAQAALRGVVTSRPIPLGDYAHVTIRDTQGFGITLEGPDFMFEQVAPGDQLDVRGIIARRGGMPVVRLVQLTTLNHTKPPPPVFRRIAQLQSPEAVGRSVTVEGRVVALGEDGEGEYLLLEDSQPTPYPVYLSRAARGIGSGLGRYHVGDRVRVSGISSQAATETPYDSKFRMLIANTSSVVLVERAWLIAPQMLLGGFLILASLLALVIYRRHRRHTTRRGVRRIHNFCEDLLTAASLEDVHRKLRTSACRALVVSKIDLYRLDRGTQLLRSTLAEPPAEPVPVAADRGTEKSGDAVGLCFRNRTPLHIANTRRSALLPAARGATARGVVLLPMFAREELIGVLEIVHDDRPRHFVLEELTALQHLANQVAMVIKLLEQQDRREQMLRSERLAAAGEIVSGVAGELRGPLECILALAHKLLDGGDPEARAILNESLRASAILSRYSHIVRQGDGQAVPIELNAVLQSAIESCRREFTENELTLEVMFSAEPLWIIGSAAQMEYVFRNLLLLAARSGRSSTDHVLRIESFLSQRRVMIAIRYGALVLDESFPEGSSPDGGGLGFSVCRGILHGVGGDVRILHAGETSCRMEIDLQAAFPGEAPGAKPAGASRTSRTLTAILLEPDPAAQHRLVSYWTSRGHRAVPVNNEAEAQELLRRLRIDVLFCAVRIPGGDWVEFFDRIRGQVPAFVLLTDGIHSDASTLFPDGDGFVLRKPMESGEMDRLLDRIGQHMEMPVG